MACVQNYPESGIRVEQRDGLTYVYLDTPEDIAIGRMMLPEILVGRTEDGEAEVWICWTEDDAAYE